MENKSYFTKLRLIFCIGFLSFVFTAFCFPDFLDSKTTLSSKEGDHFSSFSVSSQRWLLDQNESLDSIDKLSHKRKEIKKIFVRLANITHEIQKPTTDGLTKKSKPKNRLLLVTSSPVTGATFLWRTIAYSL